MPSRGSAAPSMADPLRDGDRHRRLGAPCERPRRSARSGGTAAAEGRSLAPSLKKSLRRTAPRTEGRLDRNQPRLRTRLLGIHRPDHRPRHPQPGLRRTGEIQRRLRRTGRDPQPRHPHQLRNHRHPGNDLPDLRLRLRRLHPDRGHPPDRRLHRGLRHDPERDLARAPLRPEAGPHPARPRLRPEPVRRRPDDGPDLARRSRGSTRPSPNPGSRRWSSAPASPSPGAA